MGLEIKTISDSSAARRDLAALEKSVSNVENIAVKTSKQFGSMVTSIAAISTISASFVGFTRLSDQLTNMTNRLKVVVEGEEALNEAMENTRKIALATGSDLKGVTSLYAKIYDAGRRLNLSQQQTARFTETVAKTIQLSGSTATEASAAILQFGQALTSNNLGGEELRSVLEQASFLAKTIEKGIGKGTGTLKALASKGLLTFETIFNAISKQTGEVDASFGRLEVTYGRAFTNLGTAFNLIIKSVLEAFGSEGGLASIIDSWAQDLALWSDTVKISLLRVKSFVVSGFLEIQNFLDTIKMHLPIDAIFANLEVANQYIIAFLEKVDAGFEWLYDRIIGNSWVPDIVEGTIEWFKKLLDAPVRIIQDFANSVDVGFADAARTAGIFVTSMIAGFLVMGIKLRTVFNFLAKIPPLLAAIAGFSFLKTGIMLGFDTSQASHLKIFQRIADELGMTLKQLAFTIGGVLTASFVYLNKGLIPTLATLATMAKWLTLIATFGLLKVGVMFTFLEAREKPWNEAIASGIKLTSNLVKQAFDFVAEEVKSLFEGIANHFDTTLSAYKKSFNDTKHLLEKAIHDNILVKVFRKVTDPGDTSQFGVYPSTFDSNKQSKISFQGVLDQLADLPLHIASAITLAVAAGLYVAFSAGTLRTAVISLFLIGATSFVNAIAGQGRLTDYFLDMGRSFLNVISRGITALFNGNVIQDPFGLLKVAAGLALFFESGRSMLGNLALNTLTAPTKLASSANDRFTKFVTERNIESLQKKIVDISTGKGPKEIKNKIASIESGLAESIRTLSSMKAANGETLSASRVASIIEEKNKGIFKYSQVAERAALNNAIQQTRALKEAKVELKNLPHVLNTLRENKKVLNSQLNAVKTAINESTRNLISGLSSTLSGAGGLIGGVAGFQKGTEVADRLVDATPFQKMMVVLGFSAIGQLIGATVGAVIVQALLFFFKVTFTALIARPFQVGGLIIAGALYAGYQLFKKLPGDWRDAVSGMFTREKVVSASANASNEIQQRLADIDRLKKSLFDPDVTKDQAAIIRARIVEQEDIVMAVAKRREKFLKRNESDSSIVNFFERHRGGLPRSTENRLKELEKQRGIIPALPMRLNKPSNERSSFDFKPSMLLGIKESVAAEMLPYTQGLKVNFHEPTTGGPALKGVDKAVSDTKLTLNKGMDNIERALSRIDAEIDLPRGAYDFPANIEADASVPKFLETAGTFFKEGQRQLSEAAQELAKGFKNSTDGTLAFIKRQASVADGLKYLEKTLSDINIRVDSKLLKNLSTKDIETVAEGSGKVKDFSRKASEAAKGSFAEKAALDLVAEWRKTIKNTVGTSGPAMEMPSFPGTGASMPNIPGTKGGISSEIAENQINLMDQFNIINETFPKLEYSLEEFKASTDEVRTAIFNKARAIYVASKKLDSTVVGVLEDPSKDVPAKVFQARQAVESGRLSAMADVEKELESVRNGFKLFSRNMDSLGLSIRKDIFNLLSEEQVSLIQEMYDGAKAAIETLEKDSNSGKLSVELRNNAQQVITDKAKEIDAILQTIGKTTYEKTRDSLSRFNIFIQEQVTNVATDAERESLNKYTDFLVNTAKFLDSDDEKLRLSAANMIDKISGRIEEFIFRKSNTVNDAARNVGLNYLNSMNTGIQQAFSSALHGDSSLGGGVFGTLGLRILDVITNSIIEAFTRGLTDTMFGNQGAFSGITRRFGEILYTSFGSLIGDSRYQEVSNDSALRITKPDFGKDVLPTVALTDGVVDSINGLTDITVKGLDQDRSLFSRLSASFMSGLTSLGVGLSGLLNGFMSLFGGGGGGTTGIIIGGLLNVLGMSAGFKGGPKLSGSMTKAASVFDYFANGGMILGQGTGTSDSILVKASNGEFIVNANSTKKFLPLLHAINSNKLEAFANGGIVGGSLLTSAESAKLESKDIPSQNTSNNQIFNLQITGDVSRNTRSTVMQMIPELATEINKFNKKRGL